MAVSIKVLKHSESGKSAFCRCSRKLGAFSSEVGVGYLYRADENTDLPVVGTELEWPGDVGFEPLVDAETGSVRTTKDGSATLQRIVLK